MSPKPFYNWLSERGSGVLLHPTSFPGEQGIGTLDHSAKHFIEFLLRCKMSYWQVCPLGPTGFGDSPYQTFSAFAGNPYLIDLKQLVVLELLKSEDMDPFLFMPGTRCDYGLLYEQKWSTLSKAYSNFSGNPKEWLELREEYKSFKKEQRRWLDTFALFMSLKQQFEGRSWLEWPKPFRTYKAIQTKDLDPTVINRIESHKFFQFLFFKQWSSLKLYANDLGIQIIGDISIFVALDSADVWSHPEYFQLDTKSFKPKALAGCPPDYFSMNGQLWGNPLYNWKNMKKDSYAWWIDRFKSSFQFYDIVRIDHFRGFESYWSVQADAETATEGKWVKGPGLPFFKAIQKALPNAKIIAEDLGHITPEVTQLLKDTGLPGMAVLQFAFGGGSGNFYLPHNLQSNSVIYSGTHDNDTTIGWYHSESEAIQDHVRTYLSVSGDSIGWDFIRTAYKSVCRLAIFPLQDLMTLDSPGRMNNPGNALGNWQWRYQTWQLEALTNESADYLASLGELFGRVPDKS